MDVRKTFLLKGCEDNGIKRPGALKSAATADIENTAPGGALAAARTGRREAAGDDERGVRRLHEDRRSLIGAIAAPWIDKHPRSKYR